MSNWQNNWRCKIGWHLWLFLQLSPYDQYRACERCGKAQESYREWYHGILEYSWMPMRDETRTKLLTK
jgi:hypothetical protein